ncbi:hypothetical protein [Pseudohongiella sp.]|uniref:Uncharacterized protein n=1 Tax=marine sediment metagenome TaxID=412755 RepID=A0A0F9YVY7_9ZZZZ|nr:hypothetical protein [Pseudohongiella sp.]HDZ07947.1 hypothetical protein [Pseudohongiella sp.]HEA64446.1 hypothetical protein [Pseudohongiella sp.]
MKSEQELDQLTAALPREMQPTQDLWPSLEAQLPERRPVKKRQLLRINQMLGMAAALALVVVVGWRVMLVPDDSAVPVAVKDTTMPDAGAVPVKYEMTRQFETIKAEQLAQMAPHSDNFGDWQYQMASWDQAIDQVSGALNYYPDDPRLLAQMQGLYEQQLDYLRLIGRVDSTAYLMGEEL